MRTSWRSASVLGVVAALVCPAPTAAVSQAHRESAARPFGADCSVYVEGSRATAYCHNPYMDTDRVQLHVECERWWDVDADSKPVELGPTGRATLSERCWKEIRTVWVSHLRRPS
ncbi:hypothetical protein ACIQMR_04075 [Streptomyces sp. NPDC091376]|uniref:hypothetical protein n=1 Tax=Streptomyces sp. NPDC091376 TaxID=3365994 RepID=UPI0038254359